MFCTNCGEQMRDTDKFCAECGTPAAPRPAKNRATAPAPEPSAPAPAVRSTTEAFHAPLPPTTPAAGKANQAELTFAAPARPAPPPSATSQSPASARLAPPPALSAQEEQRVLLEAEELASVRGMVPVDALPEDFPGPPPGMRATPTQACPSCGRPNPIENRFCEGCGQPLQAAPVREATPAQTAASPAPPPAPAYNAWLDTEPAASSAPSAPKVRPKAASAPPAAAVAPAKAPAEPAAKDDNFFYYYDDASSARGNRKLLVILLVVFAVGIAGIIFLLFRSPAKHAATGDVTVAISPASADLTVGQTQDFAATVTGSGDSDVTWSVAEGSSGGSIVNRGAQAQGGKVAVMGLYTAPTMPGTYHIAATSKADPSKSATAEVLVNSK